MGFRDVVDPTVAAAYRAANHWGNVTLGAVVRHHHADRGAADAYIAEGGTLTWSDYDAAADRLAAALTATGLAEGARVAVLLPDGGTVHVAYLANERAGFTTVGVGARAGEREVRHLIEKTGSSALVSFPEHRGRDMARSARALGVAHHVVVPEFERDLRAPILVDGVPAEGAAPPPGRAVGPDDLFMVNSTSGTTGLPKCVMHTQNRWMYFHQAAQAAGDLGPGDVFYGAVPAPFGFGLWTAHFTPTILGVPCVVSARFDAHAALERIERHRVTVLCAVSSQFLMMLAAPDAERYDLSSLRVMFTGGEAVPYEQAAAFERRTGATVLQFYGSNESGLATGTRLADPPERRLRTAGRRVPGTELRLFEDRRDVTETGRGQPGTRGPANSVGYLDDPEANAALFTDDGFVLHADICTLDADGWLRVVGRASDIIIRGGKNISAAQVEEEVGAHPAVAIAAAVPYADPILGERVCAFVELLPGRSLELDELVAFLRDRGTSPEHMPEKLEVLAELPRSSGGKVAKGELRERLQRPA
jgi:acyl-CoA synthetase